MIIDANVLLYCVDSHAQFHSSAKQWLEGALNGSSRVGFPWASLLAFQRISTHPRATATPLTPGQAFGFVSDWLAARQAWIPEPGPNHAIILEKLLTDGDLRGNLVTDAHLAALAIEYGVGVCSFDSDFARFPSVTWINPRELG
ncbi:MAG: type II toxin-antitoxin system VapC family toxin [Propionibacteriaceae bacterium]|nr:type II toxin-antitoxin system VapC family toxin [Propionibacteriaceae bacterium]